jgi:DNA-binding MarR family transcriptional regulator
MPAQLQGSFRHHRLTARHGGVLAQLLSRAGLVERREDPTNRRRTLAGLAEPHRATVQAFVAQRADPLLKVLEALSPRDRQGFARGLSAWAQQVREW